MKPLRYYEFQPVVGLVEVTPETSEDRIGSLYVECASCPVLVPAKPNPLVGRKWTYEDGNQRPYCLDCTLDIEQAEYDAMCAEQESIAQQAEEAYDRMFCEYERDGRHE